MLSKMKKNKYYDDKATCGKERAFLIAKRQACQFTVFIHTSDGPSHTYARSVEETKIARELPIFLKTTQFISEE